jgi:hypothetical protein
VTPSQFQSLKYGDILRDHNGNKLIVLHTNQDEAGNAPAIGVLPCFELADAGRLTLLTTSPQVTALLNPDGVTTMGILKTVPEKS